MSTTRSNVDKYIDIDTSAFSKSEIDQQQHQSYDVLLDDLLKYSTYRFRLVALDSAMNHSFPADDPDEFDMSSAELVVETPSDVPDAAPEAIQVEPLNTTSILLQWSLPPVEKRNGLIIGYKIAVKENDKQVWNSNVDSEPRRKIIAGLAPAHKYSIGITARTINGSGPASEWFTAETFTRELDGFYLLFILFFNKHKIKLILNGALPNLITESRVPGQPLYLHAEPTDTSIILHWTPPADANTTLVRKYLLKYGIGFPIAEIEIPGTRNSFIINSLSIIYLNKIS